MACSPTSSPDKSERELADALNHLVCGKRHLLVNDYVAAVASLQEACQIFSKRYGETGNECAEPYLYYGKALLEYSRMETGVLGNALQGVTPEDEDDSEDDNEEDEDEEEQVENPDKVKDESGTGEESESTGEKSQDEAASLGEEEAGPSTSTGKPKEEGEDEITNLQLAWEVLELSKVIFKRQAETDKTKELKVAEVLLKLGEVSIESENYGQAVEDLTECLDIQRKNLEPHDRALAETLYQLGLATSFSNQFEFAIENFTNSMKVIEDRINFLKQCEEDRQMNNINATVPNNVDNNKIVAKDKKGNENNVKESENSDSKKNGEKASDETSEDSSKSSEEANEEKEVTKSKPETKTEEAKEEKEVNKSKPETKTEEAKEEKEVNKSKPETKTKEAKEEKEVNKSKPETKIEVAKEKEVTESKPDKSDESMDTSGNDKTNEGDSLENSKDKSVKDEKNSTEKSGVTNNSTSNDMHEDDDPWQDTKREIEELEGLIPDIKAKIEDTEDMMKNTMQSIKEAALQRLTEIPDEKVSIKIEEKISAKPISNISHLVKRKRKPEDESSCTENDVKKPRPSEELEEKHVNGTAVLNGDSKPMETDESSKVKVVPMETQAEAEQSVA